MKRGYHRLSQGYVGVLLLLALLASPLFVGYGSGRTSRTQSSASASGHVTVIVLDMSGSMSANDPNGLRCSAANAYIDLSGPGDAIGVVGLDNAQGTTGGAHNFVTADWQIPVSAMDTLEQRKALRQAIAAQSHNCQPDGNTPTYDALAKAEKMLETATQGGTLSGSVILLTDGDPEPDPHNAQITDIQNELVPQFKAHNWPIDTIALGADDAPAEQSFHQFLAGLSNDTAGQPYDDAHGTVQGPSPFNITSFFLDIFRLRNARTAGCAVERIPVNGSTARNFCVTPGVSHLDIVVTKDTSSAQVSIVAPDGERFPPETTGVAIFTDPYYVIFSIDPPQGSAVQDGEWEVDVSGGGQFSLESLIKSEVSLGFVSPAANTALALGEAFTISAKIISSVSNIPVPSALPGEIRSVGQTSGAPSPQPFTLTDPHHAGIYSASVTVPLDAPPGSYDITVRWNQATYTVTTVEETVRLGLFPRANLLPTSSGQSASSPVGAAALQWDEVLRVLYSLPVINVLGGWPLDGYLASPQAVVPGIVQLRDPLTRTNRPYPGAQVSATAQRQGSSASFPLTVINDGGGKFHLLFPVQGAGIYQVTLTTTGSFQATHGDLTHTTEYVKITPTPATTLQEARAWLITAFYLLILLLIFLVLRYLVAPKPFGSLGDDEFAQVQRGPGGFFRPSSISSQHMGLDPGIRFYFRRGGQILVKRTRGGESYRLNGEPLPGGKVSANEGQLTLADGNTYVISPSDPDSEGQNEQESGGLRELTRRILGRQDDDDEY